MADNLYQRYFTALREVRSHVNAGEVLLLARRRRQTPVVITRIGLGILVFALAAGVLLKLNSGSVESVPHAKQPIALSGNTSSAPLVGEAEQEMPRSDVSSQHRTVLQPGLRTSRARMNDRLSSSTSVEPLTVNQRVEASSVAQVAAESDSALSISTIAPREAAQLPPVKPMKRDVHMLLPHEADSREHTYVAALSSDLLHGTVQAEGMYLIVDRLAARLTAGLATRRTRASIGAVSFRDTTIEINNTQYTSRVGTVTAPPVNTRVLSATAGLRLMMNPVLSDWNLFTDASLGVTTASLFYEGRIGASLHVGGPWFVSSACSLSLASASLPVLSATASCSFVW